MDIEGSEADVFAANTECWLPRVRNIAIELHRQRCAAVFHQALAGYECRQSQSGELTICHDLKCRTAPA